VAQPDFAGAAGWFQKASDAGDPMGMFLLAECYLKSKGVTRDPRRAVDLLRLATEKKNPEAMNALGDLFSRGVPGILPADRPQARELFEAAADAGFLDAQGNLGAMLMVGGGGVDSDPARAVELFQQGAEKGNRNCMYFLAASYEQGAGLPADPERAKEWYVKAAQAGDNRARNWCLEKKIPLESAP